MQDGLTARAAQPSGRRRNVSGRAKKRTQADIEAIIASHLVTMSSQAMAQ